jgi:hypothetical protein
MKSTNLHRIDASMLDHERSIAIKGHVEQRMPIEYAGPEPEDKPESLWSRVWSAYKAHRPHGRMDGIRHAFAAWRN